MYKIVLGLLIVVITFFSCKENSKELSKDSKLSLLESEVRTNPTKENLASYFKYVNDFITHNKQDKSACENALHNGADIAMANSRPNYAISYLMESLRTYPDSQYRKENLKNLSILMNKVGQNHAAVVLYQGYKDSYPNESSIAILEPILSINSSTSNEIVDSIFETVFINPDEYGLNKNNALKYVDVVEAYVLAYPKDKNAPDYLYKASEVARSIRTLPKALSLYDWMLDSYNSYEKSPTILFMKGFVLDDELNNKEAAKLVYEEFLNKYPENELSSSVKFLIENIGKSDEEILEFIEQNKGKQSN